MTYQDFSSVNISSGFDKVFVYVNDVTSGLFTDMFLFSLFIIIFLGSYFSQKRQTGTGNLAISFVVSAFVTTGASILLILIPGLENVYALIVCIGLFVIGILWLWMQNVGES